MTALIFDCDGVLADTERYGHLPAFNAMFERFGLPVRWSEAEYGRRLRIGGGKERLASLFTDGSLDAYEREHGRPPERVGQPGSGEGGAPDGRGDHDAGATASGGRGGHDDGAGAAASGERGGHDDGAGAAASGGRGDRVERSGPGPGEHGGRGGSGGAAGRLGDGGGAGGGRTAAIAAWHRAKTEIFADLVLAGRIPARPGIARIVAAAVRDGWTVAVASTSAEVSVRAVLAHAVGEALAKEIPVFAGDVVPAKKPDPAIYTLTMERLGLDPADTLVVEDSRNGLLAATAAGLNCLVTVNDYTRGEDFGEAVLVVSELGDPGRPPVEIFANRSAAVPGDFLTLDDLHACLPGRDAA